MRRWTSMAAGFCLASALAGCGGGDAGKDDQAAIDEAVAAALASQQAARPSEPPPAEVTPTPEPVAASSPDTSDQVDFKMPNLVGANLQDAQDEIQTLGVFFSISHDLRGSRNQVFDSNWQVCDQTPSAGTRIKGNASDYEGKIDFGVVKLTESCP